MTISVVGNLGGGASSTSSTSFSGTTLADLANGNTAIIYVATDNSTTTDGATSDHTGVTVGGNAATKHGEYTNGEGAAGSGVTVSVWSYRNTTGSTIASGATTQVTLGTAVVDKVFRSHVFSSSRMLIIDGGPTGGATDADNDYGSLSLSGLDSKQRLYFRASAKEANTTTTITQSSGWTALGTQRSRNNAAAVAVNGEYKIATSTGETSAPTIGVSGDTAGVLIGLSEAASDGALSVTLADATLSSASALAIKGTAAVTLADATLSSTSTIALKAALAATLDDATLSSTGTVAIKGALSQTLEDATAGSAGTVAIAGTSGATLDDATLSATGTLAIAGAAAITLDDASLVSETTLAIVGELSATLDDATLAATGTTAGEITGELSVTLDDATLVSTATLGIRQPGGGYYAPGGYYRIRRPDDEEVAEAIEEALEIVPVRISRDAVARMAAATLRRNVNADIGALQARIATAEGMLESLVARDAMTRAGRQAIERAAAELAALLAIHQAEIADEEEALLLLAAA